MNVAPTIEPIDDLSTNEDTPIAIEIQVADANGDSISISVTSSNENVIPVLDGTTLNLDLVDNWYGLAQITVTATDGLFIVTENFDLQVLSVNDAPGLFATIQPETGTIIEITPENMDGSIVFSWEQSIDVDDDSIMYSIIAMDQLESISIDSINSEEYSISYIDIITIIYRSVYLIK